MVLGTFLAISQVFPHQVHMINALILQELQVVMCSSCVTVPGVTVPGVTVPGHSFQELHNVIPDAVTVPGHSFHIIMSCIMSCCCS